MITTVFWVGSVTHAMRGKSYLEKNGFRAAVGRLQERSADTGCGYTVSVYQDGEKAERLLRRAGIPIRKVKQTGIS